MTEQTKTRFPAPLYAAAGAGDLAYRQLRKLPDVVNQLGERAAASLRTANEHAGARATQLRERAAGTDFDALRGNAASVASTFAQIAQDRAISLYTDLVARGERVVGSGVVEAADVVNADLETTESPKAVGAGPAREPADATKARKRVTKPAGE